MPVGRCRADAGESRRLRKGEPGGPLAGNQIERRTDQRLLEIAMMVAARRRPLVAIPRHVKRVYITGGNASTRLFNPATTDRSTPDPPVRPPARPQRAHKVRASRTTSDATTD